MSGFVKRNDFVEYGTVVDTEDVVVERVEIGVVVRMWVRKQAESLRIVRDTLKERVAYMIGWVSEECSLF